MLKTYKLILFSRKKSLKHLTRSKCKIFFYLAPTEAIYLKCLNSVEKALQRLEETGASAES